MQKDQFNSVSIIIPNFNGRKLLEQNLPAVINAAPKAEIVVVDDASTDNSVQFIKDTYPQILLVENKTNLRFALSCNRGVKAATGTIVILLNSDVSPKANFLEPLIRHFKNSDVFSVGSKEIEIKDGEMIVSGRTEGKFTRGLLVHWRPKDQESPETLWNIGGSIAIDRGKYLQIGGMDSLYAPAYWEDIDLCWRARQRGWKILFEKDSVVHHNHESTNVSVFGKKHIELISFRNQLLFVWKNIRGRMLIEHFLWLPYHLVITSYRTNGLFIKAFWLAINRYFTYEKSSEIL